MNDDFEVLVAENERLRGALELLRYAWPEDSESWSWAQKTALAALERP